MNKITTKSGVTLEAEGASLLISKPDGNRFRYYLPEITHREPPDNLCSIIRKQGLSPTDFRLYGSELVLNREYWDWIDRKISESALHVAEEKQAKQAENFERFKKEGVFVLELAPAWGNALRPAFPPEYKGDSFCGVDCDHLSEVEGIDSNATTVRKIWESRPADGWFNGTSNMLWIVTQHEWDAIVAEKVQIDKDKVELAKQDKEKNEAWMSRTVPSEAIKAYIECDGDPERLDDDIDNPSYWLVKEYASAIEHQGLAQSVSNRKFVREFKRFQAEDLPPDV